MAADRLLISPSVLSPAQVKHLLTAVLAPGRRRLITSGVLASVGTLATAAGYFAVAAIAQDVLYARSSFARDHGWLVLLAAAAAARAMAAFQA